MIICLTPIDMSWYGCIVPVYWIKGWHWDSQKFIDTIYIYMHIVYAGMYIGWHCIQMYVHGVYTGTNWYICVCKYIAIVQLLLIQYKPVIHFKQRYNLKKKSWSAFWRFPDKHVFGCYIPSTSIDIHVFSISIVFSTESWPYEFFRLYLCLKCINWCVLN